MKLEENQKATVRQLVYDKVKYNETYQEVLDHVISSLELERDSNVTFHQKLNQIWDEDFGGYENLPILEKEREKAVKRQIGKRYIEIFMSYFRLPFVLVSVTVLIVFFIISGYFLSKTILFFLLITSVAIPSIVSWIMYWKLKMYDLVKPSLRDKRVFRYRDLAYRFIFALIVAPIMLAHFFLDYSFNIEQVYLSFFVILIGIFIIHTLSYLKLYKETFKMELSK